MVAVAFRPFCRSRWGNLKAFCCAANVPALVDDECGETASPLGSEGCVSVDHEDLRYSGECVVTHILPKVFIYLECSQRPRELHLGGMSARLAPENCWQRKPAPFRPKPFFWSNSRVVENPKAQGVCWVCLNAAPKGWWVSASVQVDGCR